MNAAIHSKFPHTSPSLYPEAVSPTRWMVEILEAKSDAPTMPHGSDRPARKKTCPVIF